MKIGILVAMEEEFNPLIKLLTNECEEEQPDGKKLIPEEFHYIKHSDVFYTFNAYGKEMFVILSGVGMNNAQLATSFLVMTNKVDLVINYGLAGATSQFNIGDIVSAVSVSNMDFDLTELGRQLFEVPGVGQSITCLLRNNFKRSMCFSSNQFVTKKYAKQKRITAAIFDMELYGIAFACEAYKIPVLSLKIISDNMSSKEFEGSILDLTDKLSRVVLDEIRGLKQEEVTV